MSIDRLDIRLSVALALVALSAIIFLYAFIRHRKSASPISKILNSAAVFILLTAAYVVEKHIHALVGITESDKMASHVIGMLVWLSLTYLLTKVIDLVFWHGILTENGSLLVPRIFVYASNFFILLVTSLIFFRVELDKDVTVLLTTSGVFVVALGYLAKAPFESAVAGFFLNIAPAFKKGDYVQVSDWRGKVNIFGIVQDVGWKCVAIHTDEGSEIYISNVDIASKIVTNFSRQNSIRLFEIELTLEFKVPVSRACHIIESAMSELDEKIKTHKVFPQAFSRSGVLYVVQYLHTEKISNSDALKSIISALYYKLQKDSKIDLAQDEKGSIHKSHDKKVENALAKRTELLRKVPIFDALNEKEIELLAQTSIPRIFGPPERIIVQGEAGDSMFAIVDGHVQISLTAEGQETIAVATDGPGKYFGEMALLTGQKRGATVRAIDDVVVLEIPKSGLLEILKNQPSLAGVIAESVAMRQAENETIVAGAHEKALILERSKSLADSIRSKVLTFFGLKEEPGKQV